MCPHVRWDERFRQFQKVYRAVRLHCFPRHLFRRTGELPDFRLQVVGPPLRRIFERLVRFVHISHEARAARVHVGMQSFREVAVSRLHFVCGSASFNPEDGVKVLQRLPPTKNANPITAAAPIHTQDGMEDETGDTTSWVFGP